MPRSEAATNSWASGFQANAESSIRAVRLLPGDDNTTECSITAVHGAVADSGGCDCARALTSAVSIRLAQTASRPVRTR